MITFKTLDGIDIKDIHSCFLEAFANYEVPFNITLDEFSYMLARRGCDFSMSYGAFSGNVLVGFVLNGIGIWNGIPTAYDTGTGIIPNFQGKGIAKDLFRFVIEDLVDKGQKQYLLEVIKTNTKAVQLYKELGFEVTRTYDYYVFENKDLDKVQSKQQVSVVFKSIEKPDWGEITSFFSIPQSWQNNRESVERKLSHFKILQMLINETVVGYGAIEMHTGDIPLLVIHPDHRRKGLGTSLLKELAAFSTSGMIKMINIESSYEPFTRFFKYLQVPPGKGQYEMILTF
ncbi:GNAT family N-acetyltransferase [Aquimarina spongiae]|uniref:Ribosomal protein S18 acetylase RimI n=1 Tax=Aquimarina spongiae TaxID=570521 RepID=A0A1M6K9P0_9FLAO|nr:GNAT family N-acetyltransferase [Aquimarina spongiae]SHJ55577.1 Ribosomal protein S18 acetylase RimI [Aquimarina spongiae]